MESLTVTRWAKYGKERIYVATAAGDRVGWLDLKTGEAVIERVELTAEFHSAVSGYHPGPASAPVAGRPAPETTATATGLPTPSDDSPAPVPTTESAWVDLAANRPGQAAREQAEAHLAEMRSRTKVGTFLARAFDAKTDERAWRVGANGEETVGARLDKLVKHGWRVLHAVPVGDRGSDIDHVLIGPGGVYTINTKNHPGKAIWVSPTQIRVDGHGVEYLRNSRFEADRTRKLLTDAMGWEPPVKAALVLLTGTLLPDVTIKSGGPDDVVILDRMDIPGIFKRAKNRMTPDQVETVYALARRSTTWSTARG